MSAIAAKNHTPYICSGTRVESTAFPCSYCILLFWYVLAARPGVRRTGRRTHRVLLAVCCANFDLGCLAIPACHARSSQPFVPGQFSAVVSSVFVCLMCKVASAAARTFRDCGKVRQCCRMKITPVKYFEYRLSTPSEYGSIHEDRYERV